MNTEDPDDIDALLVADYTRSRTAARADATPDPHAGFSAPIAAHVVNWRLLDDAEAAVEWRLLRQWVEWFTVRYSVPVSVVPDCWWQHPALVEELSALHIAHLVSFDPQDTGYGPIGWHERLTLATPRMQRAGAGCTSGHQSIRPRSWLGKTDEAAWDAWIEQTHAHGDTHVSHNRKEER